MYPAPLAQPEEYHNWVECDPSILRNCVRITAPHITPDPVSGQPPNILFLEIVPLYKGGKSFISIGCAEEIV